MAPELTLPTPEATAIDQVLAERCARDFYVFVQEFWATICNEAPVWNWHIEFLCDELQQVAERVFMRLPKEYDLVINVPPGSTKSTICSQMFPAWCWARDDTLRFISASYAHELSTEQSQYTRQIMLSDKWKRLFPEVQLHKTRNAIHNFRTTKGGQRFSTSPGGTVTGIHAHIHLVDDPINPKKAATEAGLKEANDFMGKTLSRRKVDAAITVLILIMQRLHEDDPTGDILRKRPDSVRHICLPAEKSKYISPPELATLYKDGLFDPVRLTRKSLAEARIDLGTFGYSGQMDQRPVPDDGGIWKKFWFKQLTMTDVAGLARMYGVTLVWNFSVDTAYTREEENDPSAILSWARMGPYLVLRRAESFRLTQPELERRLPAWCIENGYSRRSMVMIEPKANGKSTVDNLRERTKLNVIGDKPPTISKKARAREASPCIESGRIILVEGGAWIDPFLGQVGAFPFAKHDEYVDLVNMAIEREQRNGLNKVYPGGIIAPRPSQLVSSDGAPDASAQAQWGGMV
jgi:predicted phage terminase large subunit-like protein